MQPSALLERIWTGTLTPATCGCATGIEALVDAFLPVRTLALRHAAPLGRPRLIPDSQELLPDLPLGDVLAEELGLDVAPGTLVLIVDGTESCAARAAGAAVGDLLHRLVAWAGLPLSQETEALVRLARSAQARADRLDGWLPGFDRAAFGEGLATALGSFWAGNARALRGADFLERDEVMAYLRALDPAFSGRSGPQLPDLLLQPASLTRRFEDWAAAVIAALGPQIGVAPTAA